MRYFAVSDLHGFYDLFIKALTEAGYFTYEGDKKLIVIGDVLDRGEQEKQLVEFLLELKQKGELIYIKGNHEDLLLRLVNDLENDDVFEIAMGSSYHIMNGTWQTALNLAGMSESGGLRDPHKLADRIMDSEFVTELLPSAVDYFEDGDYIFTHGWLPSLCDGDNTSYRNYKLFKFNHNWRRASEKDWQNARWYNGMEFACERGLTEEGKTVVCGHYHTSYGHARINGICSEFGKDADFSPFYDKGIIAIDACTAGSNKVNVVVIDI